MKLQERLDQIDTCLITSNSDYIEAEEEAKMLYKTLMGILKPDNQLILIQLMNVLTDRELYGIKQGYLQGYEDNEMGLKAS